MYVVTGISIDRILVYWSAFGKTGCDVYCIVSGDVLNFET